ncbi:DUF4350 domain-containing protein [Salinibacterium sp. ZJ70]|uniref:DUF4350 domain-containing protein n=1 Tax=Salinibacterium sp. ZJ70 TaxID=2708084 RepID=UPI001422A211|nr:DUF4350 domain-containing protein [Salinibacterium sp. ZJ70]
MTRRTSPRLGGIGLALVVLIALAAMWAAGQTSDSGLHTRSPLDPSDRGTLAVAEVLREQGVEVIVAHSFPDAERALDGASTLLLDDDLWVLTEEAYELVLAASDRIVVVMPTDTALEILAPGAEYAGFGGGVAQAECDLPAAERAGRVDAAGDAISAPSSAIRCFPTDSGSHALVQMQNEPTTVTLLGAGDVLRNDTVTEHGNAALVLGLLGERDRLVWYQPDIDDLAFERSDSLARYQAPWFTPLAVLLLLVGIAAVLWKGRRMGPVVVERLPVEVRASETMEGRARLYERTGARDHTIRTLRTATLARLARVLGLARTARDDEIIVAAASASGRDVRELTALLGDTPVADDRALLRLSDALLTLENDVARGVAPR